MRLSTAIEGYTLTKLADQYSRNTLNGYHTHFNQLIDFLGDIEISAITKQDLLRFFLWLKEDFQPTRMNGDRSPYKSTTMKNAWCAVRSLFGWASEEVGIPRPDLGIKQPKANYPEITPYTEDEIKNLLISAEFSRTANPNNRRSFKMRRPTGKRDKAIILMLLDSGMRVSELAHLKVKDVNMISGEIYIQPNNSARKNKARTVFMGTAAKKAMWGYLAERKEPNGEEPLFLSLKGREMDRNSIRMIITKLGRKSEIQSCYPHKFRHTFAIQYLRNRGDVFTLQRLLGHSTLDMVKKYLSIAEVDLASAHRRASPVDNWSL